MSKNHEKEGKILEIDKTEVENKINGLLGDLIVYSCVRVFNTVRLVNGDGVKVRLRYDGSNVRAETKKGIKLKESGIKNALETGISVCSLEAGIDFFAQIGFLEVLRDTKKRTQYLLNYKGEEVKIEIDEYSDLGGMEIPTLLEIEAKSKKTIVGVAKILGYDEKDLKDWGTKKLIKHYMPEKGNPVGKFFRKMLKKLKKKKS